jgi:hypothetical protein
VNRIRTATAAVLLASLVGLSPTPLVAKDQGHHDDKWDRHDDKRDRRDDVRDAYKQGYWDASRHYRNDDRRYKPRHLGRNDVIYRGSDNRYYCKRDDGTTGLIIGGVGGGVLGNIIAPGGYKTLGTIIGAGAGALIGRQVDKGDVVCR